MNEEKTPSRKKIARKLSNFYDNNYKKLLIIPMLILFVAIFLIIQKIALTGDFVNKGVSLKGGITITIPSTNVDPLTFQNYLQSTFPQNDIHINMVGNQEGSRGLLIEADFTDETTITQFKKEIEQQLNIKETDYNEEIMGASLGASFFNQTIKAIIIAFVFMSLVVFLYFKSPTASFAVVLAAFSDIVVTLAVINFMGIKLSTAGIAAFLMLIGYSVDTDILLSTRVLKRSGGSVPERIRKAMKTGFMMSITTIGAISAGLFFAKSEILIQIMTILLIGLIADIIFTWLQNAPLLRLYVEKKNV